MLDAVRRWNDRATLDRPGGRIGIIHPNVGGLPVVVGMAPERGADGRAVALFGVAYARSVALRTHVGHVLHGVSLLPKPAHERSDSASSDGARVDNAALAVRLRYASGLRDAVSAAATDSAVWRSGFVARRAIQGPDGGFTVEVAVPRTSASATWRRRCPRAASG